MALIARKNPRKPNLLANPDPGVHYPFPGLRSACSAILINQQNQNPRVYEF
jgi:hypothetical protein